MGVSVIIPALNEERCLAGTVRDLRAQGPCEIIVVDGGSTDGTVAAAGAADLVLHGPRGRALQMNLGAARATGDVLLFLHADCHLEAGALAEAERLARRPGFVAGCFRMTIRADGVLYRWTDFFANARVRLTGMAYGDQGLFLTRARFGQVGGFPPVRFLEDVLMSRRLARDGRIVLARHRIVVSPRRWQRAGIVRQTVRNWVLVGLASAGVDPDRLAAYYPAVR